ncbi:MAG: aldo/keto reductase [Gammaproteobacteria bacterium]|nr:aldo/keto reductase [Gammaproteobacteria bacterium]
MVKGVYSERHRQCGFGTYPLTGDQCMEAISTAVEIGYRAIDTAQMYQNESDTGKALSATGIPRDEFFVTTKVEHTNYSKNVFLPSVERSLEALQTDYVDVLLLHWPPPDFNIAPALDLLVSAYDRGFARHIGVSNFNSTMMREAKTISNIPIVVNQVEFHPLLNQEILLSVSEETGIPLAAYCAVARGEIFKYPALTKIGEKYGKSAAQIAQRWILQKGVSVNTMSTNPTNIKANFDIIDFQLSDVDMALVDELTQNNYRIVDKSLVPWAPKFD